MSEKITYSLCYKILNISHDSDWKELRESYKRLIQKWHPDKFKPGSDNQSIASEKTFLINIAYQKLSQYYRINNALPNIEIEDINSNSMNGADNTSASDVPIETFRVYSHETQDHYQNKIGRYLFVIVVLTIVLYIFTLETTNEDIQAWHLEDPETFSQKMSNKKMDLELLDQPDNVNSSNLLLFSDKAAAEEDNPEEDYFTFGSTIGQVISIQGAPDTIVNDIWFYGDSEVHFKDGSVSFWKRSPGSVLNARLSDENYPGNKARQK